MRVIPAKIKRILSDDPFMQKCIINDYECCPGVQWHHAFEYAGRQIQEVWAIVPICEEHHKNRMTLEYAKLVGLQRATKEELAKYPKKDWQQLLKYLTKKYVREEEEKTVQI